MKRPKTSPTQNLNERETAWFQLISAAGSLLDRIQAGQITDDNREDAWVLYECALRVLKVEGMQQRTDCSDYEIHVDLEPSGKVKAQSTAAEVPATPWKIGTE